jgi:hypothetical protein
MHTIRMKGYTVITGKTQLKGSCQFEEFFFSPIFKWMGGTIWWT